MDGRSLRTARAVWPIRFPLFGLRPPASSRTRFSENESCHGHVLPGMGLCPRRAVHSGKDMTMRYDRSAHRVHHHRFHIVRLTECRCRVLAGDPRPRVRTIRRRACRGNGVGILHGVPSGDHVRMSVSVPPRSAIPDPVPRYLDSHLPDATGASR